ncbi:MAG: tripartite tricarboxylate transporter substrate binding protein [Paralcaligenes sp.]
MKKIHFVSLMFASLLLLPLTAARAQYPERPIRLIVPWPAGGSTDAVARILAQGLGETLGGTVIVENKGGANGVIGTRLVAVSPPDGYTLLMGSSGPLTVAGAVQPTKLSYDPVKSFTPVMLVAKIPLVLVVNPSVPAHTLKEFIRLAKAQPSHLTLANAGVGSSNQLTGALFQSVTNTKLTNIPYKGSGPALTDLIGGQVNAYFDQISTSSPLVHSGKLRAIVVTSKNRSAQLPDTPTMEESGFPGFDTNTFFGILLPAGASKAVVNRLNAALIKTVRLKKTQDSFTRLGFESSVSTPREFHDFMKKDLSNWSKVARDNNITLE